LTIAVDPWGIALPLPSSTIVVTAARY
jgi:hypothetical protein